MQTIPMTKDMDTNNLIREGNSQFRLYFETEFSDSISVKYGGVIVFKNFVKTIRRIEAAKEFCVIDNVKKGQPIELNISGIDYRFKPIEGYRYYYFTKVGRNIGIIYSNVMREYY